MNCFQGKELNFVDPFFHLRKIIEPIFLFTKAWEKTTSNVAHILALQTRIKRAVFETMTQLNDLLHYRGWLD